MNISKSIDIYLWPLVAVLIYFVCQLFGQFVVQTVLMYSSTSSDEVLRLGNVAGWAQLVSAVVIVGAMMLVRGFRLRRSFRFPRVGVASLFVAFVAVLFALFGGTVLNDLLESQFAIKLPLEYEQLFKDMMSTPVGIFSTCVAVPLCEEVVFRAGLMNPLLSHGVNPWIPVSLSAVLFGVFHGNVVQMSYAIPAGFVFAVVYYLTGSLFVPVLCHVLNNTVMVVLMLQVPEVENFHFTDVFGTGLSVGLLLLAAFLSVLLLYRLWSRLGGSAGERFSGVPSSNDTFSYTYSDSSPADSQVYDKNIE